MDRTSFNNRCAGASSSPSRVCQPTRRTCGQFQGDGRARTDATLERLYRAITLGFRLGNGWLLIFVTFFPTVAAAQTTSNRDLSVNSGEDFLRPPRNLFQVLYEYETAPGSGTTSGSIATVTHTAITRAGFGW